jgi:hypothetical protein
VLTTTTSAIIVTRHMKHAFTMSVLTTTMAVTLAGAGCIQADDEIDELGAVDQSLSSAFTFSPASPLAVNQVATFDGSASVCDNLPCRYIWQWYYFSSSAGVWKVGGQLGEGTVITYSWSAPRSVRVQLKVVNSNSTNNFKTSSQYLTVQ